MTFCMDKDKEKFDQFVEFVDSKKGAPGAVMPVLQEAQRIFGYIPEPIVDYMALSLDKPSSEIYGVATFYSQFSFEPKGDHELCVCMGTACYVKGADKLLSSLSERLGVEVGKITTDGQFSLTESRCVGDCGIAPVLTVDGKNLGFVSVEDLDQIIEDAKEGRINE